MHLTRAGRGAVIRRTTHAALIAIGALSFTTNADARPPGPATFCATYPSSPICKTGQPACALCHDGGPPARNPFGAAIEQKLLPGVARPLTDSQYAQGLPAALKAVEAIDSDADGTTNVEEIALGTFPGSAKSAPAKAVCPPKGTNPAYDVCHYDARYVFRKVSLDFCGEPPAIDEVEKIAAMAPPDQAVLIDELLDKCLASEFWAGKNGQVWQLANSKVRPIGAFKGGPEDGGFLPLADYYHDFRLWAYTQTGDHDCREVITADYWVKQTGPVTYVPLTPAQEVAEFKNFDDENVQIDKRAGLLTSRWTLLYTTMFAVLPRGTAAQAMRAFLDQEIARMEGLTPVGNEPVDYDKKGVTNPTCAACHSTLDPLAYAYRNYNGFGNGAAVNPPGRGPMPRATYVEGRMEWFEAAYPGISKMPSGFIFAEPVGTLMEWAEKAANSDPFARARVNDYWQLLIGRDPMENEAAEFAKLAADLKGPHRYRIARMLHDLVRTEAYGAP